MTMTGRPAIWTFIAPLSGSGGSTCALGAAAALARRNKRVILADADPGAGSLPHLMGASAEGGGLDGFLTGALPTLDAALAPTQIEGLKLLAHAGRLPEIADSGCSFRAALTTALLGLEADCVVVDLGSSTSGAALDFGAASAVQALVVTAETASLQGAYDHIKLFVFRRLARLFIDNPFISDVLRSSTEPGSPGAVRSLSDLCERIASLDERSASLALAELKAFSFSLVLNKGQGAEAAAPLEALATAARTILGVRAEQAGAVRLAAGGALAVALDTAAADFDAAADALEAAARGARASARPETAPGHTAGARTFEPFGYNDDVKYQERIFHVQTEVYGGANPRVETAIYQGGRVYLSKKSEWRGEDAGELKTFAGRQHAAAVAAVKSGRVAGGGLRR